MYICEKTYMLLFLQTPEHHRIMELRLKISLIEKQIRTLEEEMETDEAELKRLNQTYNPNVSIYEVNVNGFSYLKGSFQFKTSDGRVHRSTIHIGRTDTFKNGKNDPEVWTKVHQKMNKLHNSKKV